MMVRTFVCEALDRFPAGWGQVIRRPTAAATFHNGQLSYWDALVSAAFPEDTGIGWFEVRTPAAPGDRGRAAPAHAGGAPVVRAARALMVGNIGRRLAGGP